MSQLRELVASRSVVFVVGAGVTVGATGRRDLTWTGLIERGLDQIEAAGLKPTGWIEIARNDLEYGRSANDPASPITAATKVTAGLGGQSSGTFSAWLRSEFQDLPVKSNGVIEAIARTGAPVLTTNYDDVLSRSLGRSTATWRDPAQIQAIMAGRSSSIGHLHGIWNQPETLIFGDASYGAHLNDDTRQQLQRAVASMRSLVFVGCGVGLNDPNIGGVLQWLETYNAASEVTHFNLCLRAEGLEGTPSQLRATVYGDSHEELANFIADLADDVSAAVPVSLHDYGSRSVEHIRDSLRSETVLADHLPDSGSASAKDLVIPPILLPVTQEQFVKSQDLEPSERFRRFDSSAQAVSNEKLLLVGDQQSGLSTSLRWLLSQNFDQVGGAIPIFVDFRTLKSGHRPLQKVLIRELRATGLSVDSEDIPTVSLAIDNFSSRPEKIFARVAQELKSLPISYLAVGTRTGHEAELAERLRDHGVDVAIRYLGRMNTGDITSLAALVAPGRADRVARRAVDIINQEHLPRTPFTVGLLISALLAGEAFMATSSESALLDAYISLLLGRGDPHDDARFTLDAYERGEILVVLAKTFVYANSGSLPEDEVSRILRDYFDAIDWTEDPMEVLFNLRSRHVIRISNGNVSFSQASYLHLFAAKAASGDAELRRHLFNRPLHYSSILRHYAALERGDEEVLRMAADLVAAPAARSSLSSRNFYSEMRLRVLDAESIDELVVSLESYADFDEQDQTTSRTDDEAEQDFLDTVLDNDQEPFPADLIEEAAPLPKIIATLTLVSNVLRDSEMVTDLELKQNVLAQTLAVWGRLVELLESDEVFTGFVTDLADRVFEESEKQDSKAEKQRQDLLDTAAILVGLGGMESTLATRKLLRSLRRCFEDEEFMADPAKSVMGALLAFNIEGSGFPSLFKQVQRDYPRRKVVDMVMTSLAQAAYYYHHLSSEDLGDLEEFVSEQYVIRSGLGDDRSKKQLRGRVKQSMQAGRAKQARARLGRGETILNTPPVPRELAAKDADRPRD